MFAAYPHVTVRIADGSAPPGNNYGDASNVMLSATAVALPPRRPTSALRQAPKASASSPMLMRTIPERPATAPTQPGSNAVGAGELFAKSPRGLRALGGLGPLGGDDGPTVITPLNAERSGGSDPLDDGYLKAHAARHNGASPTGSRLAGGAGAKL